MDSSLNIHHTPNNSPDSKYAVFFSNAAYALEACYNIASFVGKNSLGNPHSVFHLTKCSSSNEDFFTHESLNEILPKVSLKAAPYIAVFFLIGNDGDLSARFFHHGREVQRCGSGSIALSYVTFNVLKPKATTVHVNTVVGAITLGVKRVSTPTIFYYEGKYLPLLPCHNKKLWHGIVNKPAQNIVFAGPENHYCIIILNSEKAVKECILHARKLCQLSGRAVIVSALSHDQKYDYVMRYFTPQYGQYEDRATGSANAMLASYWQQKLNKTYLRGHQLSQAGGVLNVQRCGLKQRVLGVAKELPC